MLRLPEEQKESLRRPFGELYTDIDDVLPLIRRHVTYTVGDVVTYSLAIRGIVPDVAIIDGHTMRTPCRRTPVLGASRRLAARNPAGAITTELVEAIRDAVARPPALLFVDGEEDLAVIPLVLAAPEGAAVLYGQPGEGVVVRFVDDAARSEATRLLKLFVRV